MANLFYISIIFESLSPGLYLHVHDFFIFSKSLGDPYFQVPISMSPCACSHHCVSIPRPFVYNILCPDPTPSPFFPNLLNLSSHYPIPHLPSLSPSLRLVAFVLRGPELVLQPRCVMAARRQSRTSIHLCTSMRPPIVGFADWWRLRRIET